MTLKAISLFSGIGGLDLSAEMAGIETVAQCEIDDYCNEILKRRFPHAARFSDVRSLTGGILQRLGLLPIDIIFGGFPCQDVSMAGLRTGLVGSDGEATRSGLWFEMRRIISEVRPRWVVAENVRGLLSIPDISGRIGGGFGVILRDLAELGFNAGWCCYGTSDIGGIHRRERVTIVAYSHGVRRNSLDKNSENRLPILDLQNHRRRAYETRLLPFSIRRLINNPVRGFQRNDDGLSSGWTDLRDWGMQSTQYNFTLSSGQ